MLKAVIILYIKGVGASARVALHTDSEMGILSPDMEASITEVPLV